eukprot:scaffold190563_cov22-Tisochrysis_lutea.AAC.1
MSAYTLRHKSESPVLCESLCVQVELLGAIHEFMKKANDNGSISRQEAVSMVPPLFLDVQPSHRVSTGQTVALILSKAELAGRVHGAAPFLDVQPSQSAESTVPPLFLDVQPSHRVNMGRLQCYLYLRLNQSAGGAGCAVPNFQQEQLNSGYWGAGCSVHLACGSIRQQSAAPM